MCFHFPWVLGNEYPWRREIAGSQGWCVFLRNCQTVLRRGYQTYTINLIQQTWTTLEHFSFPRAVLGLAGVRGGCRATELQAQIVLSRAECSVRSRSSAKWGTPAGWGIPAGSRAWADGVEYRSQRQTLEYIPSMVSGSSFIQAITEVWFEVWPLRTIIINGRIPESQEWVSIQAMGPGASN